MRNITVSWFDAEGYYTRYFAHEKDARKLEKALRHSKMAYKIRVKRDEPISLEHISADDLLKELFR